MIRRATGDARRGVERRRLWRFVWLVALLLTRLAGIILAMFRSKGLDDDRDDVSESDKAGQRGGTPARLVETVPGMPPLPAAANLYSESRADKLSATVAASAARGCVPNLQSNDVYVID